MKKKNSDPIVVALDNSEQDQALMEHAIHLSEQFDSPLHLVHCYQGEMGYNPDPLFGEVYNSLIQSSFDFGLKEAKEYLEKQAKPYDVTFKLLKGSPSQALISEAQSHHAWLILAATHNSKRYRYLPKSMSTLLKLLNLSPIPVMVISEESKLQWSNPVNISCADDLTSSNPSTFAAKLAKRNPEQEARLTLVHVSPMTKEVITAGLKNAMAAAHNLKQPDFEGGEVFNHINDRIKGLLEQRIPDWLRPKVLSFDLRYGVARQELERHIEESKPDIVVFGKHQNLHHKPFYFGQVPFSTAFALQKPFVVVPG